MAQGRLMTGKRGLVMGVANDRSIAWGIAKATADQGAELAFTYQGEALEKRVRPLAQTVGAQIVLPCDVTDDASLDRVFEELRGAWGRLDFLVHAIAFSDKEELKGQYLATSRRNFAQTMDISCYSFTACAQRVAPLMTEGGSLLTLTYYGAERVMPHYNVMGVAKAALEASVRYLAHDLGPRGVRVNAVSAGPIRTLAARGVSGISKMVEHHREVAPLRRATEQAEVGDTALFLLSPLARGITGEVIYVDGATTSSARSRRWAESLSAGVTRRHP